MSINMHNWTFDKFRQMCILSGCDYLPSLPGIGIKTAWKELAGCCSIEQVFKKLRVFSRGKYDITPEYEQQFQQVCSLGCEACCPLPPVSVLLAVLIAKEPRLTLPFFFLFSFSRPQ